ncbi:MAG: ornithine aminomutase subunit alpha [Clostridiales Family XIII bacterium]|jgi:D-ornithine 4,5-aminomutase subunit alpha|nr:ornithine aminomutase subunit alpha [Clostridiales Family XIII bacterium]
MKRQDDFAERRKDIMGLTDDELYKRFWDLTEKVVEPLLELGKKNTSPSIERSVLLRMGIPSTDTKPIVEGCIDRGLLGKGAGHVVYKLAKSKDISMKEAGELLANGSCWDEAAGLFDSNAASKGGDDNG